MVKITYLTLNAPHVGHINWIKAMRELGHEVKVVSMRRPPIPNPNGVLITEGVRPTIIGAMSSATYRCWAAVALSPAILNSLINFIYTLPDIVISVSKLVRKLINNKSAIIHPTPPELETLLRIRIENKEPWICYSGSFIPIKGLHVIPNVAHILSANGAKVQFMLIGGTGEEIMSKARRLGVENYIKPLGPKPRIEALKILSKCLVYLQPSLFDAFSISVVEGMALGAVPVVTKNVGSKDLVELLDKSLITDLSAERIADALLNLLSDEKKLKEYSKLSREIVKQELSFSKIAMEVQEFINACI